MNSNLKIKKLSAADMVCEKLKEMITEGEWAVGEKLPAEQELANIFGVNRLTVRIALQRLNALGVLQTRVGEGTFVTNFNFPDHIAELSDFYVNDKVISDATEYRKVLELEAVKLAIARQTEEGLKEIARCCQAFEDEVKRFYTLTDKTARHDSFVKTVDIGVEFHKAIFEMTDNELLKLSFSIAKEPVRQHMLLNASKRILNPKGQNSSVWIKTYWAVYEAIQNRDVKVAQENLLYMIEQNLY